MSNNRKNQDLRIDRIVRDDSRGDPGTIAEIHYVDPDGNAVRIYMEPPDKKEQ